MTGASPPARPPPARGTSPPAPGQTTTPPGATPAAPPRNHEVLPMAETVQQPVKYEDVAPLRSRISWGAIFAGMVVALACALVLTLFFTGIGLSLTATDIRSNALEIG